MEIVYKNSGKHNNQSPTIGLLLENTINRGGYQTAIWQGVADVVEEQRANLICFVGDTLGYSPLNKFAGAQNAVYNLASPKNVDGLIVSGTLGTFINDNAFQVFCKNYNTIPIVLTVKSLPNIPTVLVDNEMGMREMLAHLIQEHKCKNIGFIRGPRNNPDAERRYDAYRKILGEQNIMFDENIVVDGDFMENSGALAVEVLLDERKVKLDVLMAANDNMARGALEALRQRLFNIPGDLALVGFDDDSGSRNITPSLTTVSHPTKEQGRMAAEMLLALLNGEKNIELRTLPTKFVVRESCGCVDPIVANARVGLTKKLEVTLQIAIEESISAVLNEIREKFPSPYVDNILQLVAELMKDFVEEAKKISPGVFLKTLDKVLHQVPPTHNNKYLWQEVISSMRRNLWSYLNNQTLSDAEDLLHQARVMVAKRTRREEGYRRIRVKKHTERLEEISQALMMASDERGIMKILTHWLPWLEISGCYISLYDNFVMPVEHCRLVLAYQKDVGSIELMPKEKIFPSWQLMPTEILPKYKPYYLIVEPLYFQEKQLGIIVFEIDRESLYGGDVYETLGRQISSSLWRVRLDQYQRSLYETAKVIAKVIVQENLQSALNVIVAGTRDVFQCDAVTLYPYNSATEELGHPPAISGLNHPELVRRLNEVERDSVVYKMLDKKEPYVVEVIAQDPDFKDRRFVKDEQIESCVAIPLDVAGQKVGVMFVNYRNQHHFTNQEVDDIRLFAYQAAAAIRNAQLYDQATRKAKYLLALNNAGMAVTSTLSLDEILDRIVEPVRLITGNNGKPASLVQLGLVNGKKLEKRAWQSDDLRGLQRVTSIIDLEEDKVVGIMGRAVITGKSILCKDVTHDKDYLEYDPRTVSELAVPIILGEKVIGVINAEHPDYAAFDEADQQYLESLATQVAIAIQNAQMFAKLQGQYDDLERIKGMVGSYTALDWMRMVSTVWGHSIRREVGKTLTSVELVKYAFQKGNNSQGLKELEDLYKIVEDIGKILITAPLSAEDAVSSVHINRIVQGYLLNQWKHARYKPVDLVSNLQSDLDDRVTVRASEEWLRRGLEIVVENAVQAMLGVDSKEKFLSVNTRLIGNKVEILISDTGHGIPVEMRDLIFRKPIEKPKGSRGAGVGCALAGTIFGAYRGNIKVQETGLSGTTIAIMLPIEGSDNKSS